MESLKYILLNDVLNFNIFIESFKVNANVTLTMIQFLFLLHVQLLPAFKLLNRFLSLPY